MSALRGHRFSLQAVLFGSLKVRTTQLPAGVTERMGGGRQLMDVPFPFLLHSPGRGHVCGFLT